MGEEKRQEFRVSGEQVGQKIRELVEEGQARKIIVKKPNGEVIREFKLNRGLAAGALLALIAPGLVAIGAIVAFASEIRIEVVKEESDEEDESASDQEPNAASDE